MSKNSPLDQSDVRLTVLHAMSELVNTGLSKDTLKICMELVDNGVSSRALVQIIKTIREGVEQKESGGEDPESESDDSDLPSPVTCRKLY
ncbi:uncharacterized protein Mzt1 [Drosophila takahashii]|uniref:uncharacterized protein Mzt1 n=1 Tax=Drosophila takahashii TaxID=29030 RepID=UPI0038995A39